MKMDFCEKKRGAINRVNGNFYGFFKFAISIHIIRIPKKPLTPDKQIFSRFHHHISVKCGVRV